MRQEPPTVAQAFRGSLDARPAAALMCVEGRKEDMNKIFRDLLKTAREQVFGVDEELRRQGKLVLTKKALEKMLDWGMSEEGLKLTFEYGTKTTKENGVYQISRNYAYFSENLWYIEEYRPVKGTRETEKVCVVITCWKGRVRA